MSPARRAAVIVAGVFGLVAVVVTVVFVVARSATKPPAPVGAVTVTQTSSAEPGAAAATPAPPPSPSGDPQTEAHEALVTARARSLQGLALDGRWVLQLSSKRDGIVDNLQTAADGSHTFHYADIRAQFDQLSDLARNAGMVPIVLTANDFGTKRSANGDQLWVLLADPGGVSSQAAAQAKCAGLFPQAGGAVLSNACVPRTLVPLP